MLFRTGGNPPNDGAGGLNQGFNIDNLTTAVYNNTSGTGNEDANVITGNSGDNALSGLGGNDTLLGGDGNDTLDGGVGDDSLTGGAGNDSYVVDNIGDVVTEAVGQGTDTVQSSIDYTLGADVENLTLTGSAFIGIGNDDANVITGNASANVLIGFGGNDTLDGGAGGDMMVGGLGNDTYVVDNAGDFVVESANEGIDTVNASTHYRLAENVENLTLTGSADLQAYGNSDANTLTGNAGNNLLDGEGGADTMLGGAGNDVYFVDNAGDAGGREPWRRHRCGVLDGSLPAVGERGSPGPPGQRRPAGLRQQRRQPDRTATPATIILDGGAGADVMFGGAGNDVYFVDNAGDRRGRERRRRHRCGRSRRRTSGWRTTWRPWSCKATPICRATATAMPTSIFGNAGNNILNGEGGADAMIGGAGNDVYFVDNAGDVRDSRMPAKAPMRCSRRLDLPAVGERGNPGPARERRSAGLRQQRRQQDLSATPAATCSTARAVPTSCSAVPATTCTLSTISATG